MLTQILEFSSRSSRDVTAAEVGEWGITVFDVNTYSLVEMRMKSKYMLRKLSPKSAEKYAAASTMARVRSVPPHNE